MRIDNRGVELEVYEDGPTSGPPVLLLHDIGSCAATYDFLVDVFAGHRLLRLDFRGHGRSDRAPGEYLIDDYTSDAAAVIAQCADTPVPIVGHSLGGVTAAHLATVRPELVSAVFLEDPPLFLGDKAVFERTPFAVLFPLIRTAVERWQADGASAGDIAAQLQDTPTLSGRGTMGEEQLPDAIVAIAEGFARLDTSVYGAVLDGPSFAAFDPAAPIAVPGLLLQPDEEMGAAFLRDHADVLRAASPAVDVVRVEGAGHLIHDSRAHRHEYVRHLTDFLERAASTHRA